MSEPPLVQEIRQGAMWIRLNRPEAMNSLTPQLLAGLSAALDEAQARDEVKAIVLTGAGRAFCAGTPGRWESLRSSPTRNFSTTDRGKAAPAQGAGAG